MVPVATTTTPIAPPTTVATAALGVIPVGGTTVGADDDVGGPLFAGGCNDTGASVGTAPTMAGPPEGTEDIISGDIEGREPVTGAMGESVAAGEAAGAAAGEAATGDNDGGAACDGAKFTVYWS